jgi:hypothetical protein
MTVAPYKGRMVVLAHRGGIEAHVPADAGGEAAEQSWSLGWTSR